MKTFRLQSVLDYRKRNEEMSQKSLLLCLENQKILNAKMEKGRMELQKLHRALDETKRQGAALQEIMLYEDCILSKKRQLRVIDRELQMICADAEQKRQVLFQARQEKRALEILKENRDEEEKRNRKHRENIYFDEVAIIGFGDKNERI